MMEFRPASKISKIEKSTPLCTRFITHAHERENKTSERKKEREGKQVWISKQVASITNYVESISTEVNRKRKGKCC